VMMGLCARCAQSRANARRVCCPALPLLRAVAQPVGCTPSRSAAHAVLQ